MCLIAVSLQKLHWHFYCRKTYRDSKQFKTWKNNNILLLIDQIKCSRVSLWIGVLLYVHGGSLNITFSVPFILKMFYLINCKKKPRKLMIFKLSNESRNTKTKVLIMKLRVRWDIFLNLIFCRKSKFLVFLLIYSWSNSTLNIRPNHIILRITNFKRLWCMKT